MKRLITPPGLAAAPALASALGHQPSTPKPAPLTMKSIPQLKLAKTFFALFAAYFTAGLALIHAAPPSLQPLIHPGTWEGWPGGTATELAVAGNYAYVGLFGYHNSGLAVIDVRDPLRFRQVGTYVTNAPLIVTSLAVSGNHAYLGTQRDGLFVIDVSNPTNCFRIGGCPTPGPVSSLVVSGRYAYLSCGTNGLVIIDVSDPAHCAPAGGFTTTGPVNSLAVAGRYAYLAIGTNGLVVVDVNDPADCRKVGAYTASGEYAYIGRVEVAGSHAFATRHKTDGTTYSLLQVIDVSNPTNCVPLAFAGSPGVGGAKLAVSGNNAYHVLRDQDGVLEVYVYDVSNPDQLVWVRTIDASFDGGRYGSFSIAVSGGCIFVTDSVRLRVFPAGNPPDPACAGQYATARSGNSVTVAGRHAYVAEGWGGLRVINVEDRANPVGVGHYETLGYAQSVVVSGRYTYVASNIRHGNPRSDTVHNSGLLEVIDVSDPTNCRPAGQFDFGPNRSVDVAVSGHYAYVTDGHGLQVIDVTHCNDCVRVGGCAINGAHHVAVAGHYVFVGGDQDVHVIDVSDPTNCVSLSRFGLSAEIRDVAVSGQHAYVITDSPNAIHVFDVSDPANPVRAARCEQGVIWGRAVAGSGHLVCVTDEDFDRFHVIDLSDPVQCIRLGGTATGGYPVDVTVAADRIYVLTVDARLLVFASVPNVQFTVRVDAGTLGTPYTLEAATSLTPPIQWSPLWTTNPPALPFDYVDFDVKLTNNPHKIYRVRQP